MVDTQRAYLNCSRDVVGGLIETATTALMEDFPRTTVSKDDIEMILDALHVLCPNAVELGTLDGLLYVVRSQWSEAIHTLLRVSERAPTFSYAKALLSFSLSATGDPAWRPLADEVLESTADRSVKAFVMSVVARNDLVNAVRVARLGGKFVPPGSIAALKELNRPEGCVDAHQAGLAPDHLSSSMRV